MGEEFKAEQEIVPQEVKQSVHQEPVIVNKEIAMMIRVQLVSSIMYRAISKFSDTQNVPFVAD